VTNLALIILQAPLIAMLLALVFHGDSRFLPLSFYFCVTVSAIWIGGVNSIREIARERELYEREFRAGLSAAAYVTSKCIVFSILGFFQALLFTASLHIPFEAYNFTFETVLLCTVTAVSGTILGLCISAFSGNVNRAVSLLPIIFIPQIFFSGILYPFDRMPDFGRIISHVTISRPAFSMFKKVCVLDQPVGKLTEWIPLVVLNAILVMLIMMRMRWHYFFTKSGK
jgi:ABC-type multidrug transport system permease subunit